jgi:hypothetical protein
MSLDAQSSDAGRSFADRILRRGPLEAIATAIIAAGVVMLMQPFSLTLYSWSFATTLFGTGDVHHCLEGQGVGRMAQIRVEALDKSFGNFHAVKEASFTVEDGEFLCLLGPSGCGKTTTLRMIAGLELPTAGTIRLDGEDVTMNRASARDIAFRVPALRPLSAYECPAQYRFPPEMRGHRRGGSPTGGLWRPHASCAFHIFSTGRCRVLPAAIGSASRLDARSCASRNAS